MFIFEVFIYISKHILQNPSFTVKQGTLHVITTYRKGALPKMQ